MAPAEAEAPAEAVTMHAGMLTRQEWDETQTDIILGAHGV